MEAEFAEYGAKRVVKEFFACNTPGPLFLPKGKCFANPPGADIESPPWITDDEIEVFASKFEKSGFTGGLNYYRVLNLNWEMTSPWTGAQVKVPTKFIIGDLDFVYHTFDTDKYVNGEAFKQDVPDVEVVVLEGVAHWIQQEKPDETTKHIADFIANF
uniref:Epoxide hydrolase n=1 Tax=Kalanchoe fedtschenkoi TaxID=63787 RepID=A0A7N0UY75_KALFE